MRAMTELWAPVLINGGIFKDDYLVSNMGRVKQKRTYKDGSIRFVLVKIINTERPVVKMSGAGKDYRKSVAKLVLSSFDYRDGCECANITYLDGNMKNCRLSNLRYTADKGVYTQLELNRKTVKSKTAVIRKPVSKPMVVKPADKPVIKGKLCFSCTDYPCFEGIQNMSTDFAKEGCKRYKPKQINNE